MNRYRLHESRQPINFCNKCAEPEGVCLCYRKALQKLIDENRASVRPMFEMLDLDYSAEIFQIREEISRENI